MTRHRHPLRQAGHHVPRSSTTARSHRLDQAFIRHALVVIPRKVVNGWRKEETSGIDVGNHTHDRGTPEVSYDSP